MAINRLFILLILFSLTLFSKELKKVTLQLSWFDQFQFAGYYMAKEKGIYEKAGFDVKIIPFNFDVDVTKFVSEGKVDFGVERETLILDKIKRKNLVALYALFQATPLVLLSTKESGINQIKDFTNKKIMTTIDDAGEVSLKAMLSSKNLDMKKLNFLKHTHDINDLINKNTDIISAYVSKSPYILKKQGIEFNIFDPKNFGFDMYSDFLFTSENVIKKDLKLVEDFRTASLKGWEYAYSNIEESVDVILKKYNAQKLTKGELLYEAIQLRKLSYFDHAKLGDINKEKVSRIHDLYSVLGLLDGKINTDTFIFDDYKNFLIKEKLSQNHKEYIESKKIVSMCTLSNLRPYSFFENGQFKGFASDFYNLIEKKTGLKFNIVKTDSLVEALKYNKEKKCDIIFGLENIKERSAYLNFTKPYIDLPFVLITKSDMGFIEDISFLKNKKISLRKGTSANIAVREKYPDSNFVDVEDMNEALTKIKNKEIYGHIDLLYTSWYKIYTDTLDDIKISARLDFSVPISIGVTKEDTTLLEILNHTLGEINKKTKDDIFRKWVTIKYEKDVDYSLLWKILLAIAIILVAILYRQRVLRNVNDSLKEKVDEKNKELIQINKDLEKKIKKEVNANLQKDRLLSQQSKMIAMGQMMESIAHQWRQPLSLISLHASNVKMKQKLNDLDNDFILSSMRSILDTSQYLSETIDDFRYFFEPQKERNVFSLAKCCEKTLNLLNASFKTKEIDIKLLVDEKITIDGYERELIQVLMNILNNSKDALKDSKEEHKLIEIKIFEDRNKNITMEIKDNAGGIDEGIIDKIYEPYFTTKHRSQGTGIGLYMCEEIVTKHMNGSINTQNVEFVHGDKTYMGAMTRIVFY